MASLRERQRELTRALIIDAVAHLVTERGVHAFSMDDVATRAGVSLRTVYRYFSSRDELMSAMVWQLSQYLEADGEFPENAAMPPMLDGLNVLTNRFAVMSEHQHLARATAAMYQVIENTNDTSDELEELRGQRAHRHEAIKAALVDELPGMPDEVVLQLFAVSRFLCSIIGWSNLTGSPANLSAESSATVVRWTIATLLKRARVLEAEGVMSLEEDL